LIVIDTSVLVAFHNKQDSQHALAARLMGEFFSGRWGNALLLEYVVLETLTVLMNRRSLSTAIQAGKYFSQSQELEFVPCSEFYEETLRFFYNQRTTKLSFVDAALAVTALAKTSGMILTFDGEFKKVPGLKMIS
jgi:predicted nucleic acid-binding protein